MFRLQRKNFLPQGFGIWVEKVIYILKSILTFGVILFFGIALFYYSPFDESFNSASTLPIQNQLGRSGSYTADFLMQFFGYGAYFSLLLLGFIPFNFFNKDVTGSYLRVIVFFFLSIVLFALFLNTAFLINGGVFAYLISSFIFYCVDYLHIRALLPVFSALILMASVFCAFLAFRKTPQDIISYAKNILHKITLLYALTTYIIAAAWNLFKKHILKVESEKFDVQTNIATTLKDILKEKKTTPRVKKVPLLNDMMTSSSLSGDLPLIEKTTSYQQISADLPPFDLLDDVAQSSKSKPPSEKDLQTYGEALQTVLEEFGVRGEIVNIRPGPVVTMYEFKPAPGIKASRVVSLSDDIARSMSALSARIAIIAGQNVIGIELPNISRATVYLKDLLLTEQYKTTATSLPLVLGKDIGGEAIVADLTRMPHLLVAGTTGSGKSVAINAMILSLLFKLPPEKCRFIMIDPKMLELSIYDDIPHLLTPVVTDPKKAVVALKWAVKEMENRYHAMSKLGVRNIDGYNIRIEQAKKSGEILSKRVQTGFDPDSGKPIFESQNFNLEQLPYIVVVVDEMADLMLVAGKEIEGAVQRLAQMARAAGIHLIMATQRPSVDVITGTIKANFPTRISFMVTSKIDSRTILGEQGAEQLLGHGDMLYMAGGGRIQRVHGPFMKDDEVERVVAFLKDQGEPSYIDQVTQDLDEDFEGESDLDNDKDPMYKKAVDLIRREGKVSTSFIQRHLSIGYNRAARIVDQMEAEGIISPAGHTGKREIL
jgi:S-DNA-T family DNA segregation ATPase FtsK/SpoIIIE